MTEHSTGLPTLFRGSASDTPAPLPRHLSCAQARPARSAAPANCRKVQHWTHDLAARLTEHAQGRGARLLEVVRAAGIGWQLARTWEGGRDRERQLKNQGGASRCCPACGVRPRPAREPRPTAGQAAPRSLMPGPPPRLPPYERGAECARRAVQRQIAAGFSSAQIAEIQQNITGAVVPERLTDDSREQARGYAETAAALIEAHRAAHTAQPTEAAPAAQLQEEGTTVNTDTSPALETRPATQWQKGAMTAHQIITAQAEAGYSADRIAAKWEGALATYDATASPQEREWHRGASETAADMIQTLRDMERAEAEQAQAGRDRRQAVAAEAMPELEAEAG